MNTTIATFEIEAYEEVLALWRRSDGVGLSDADSRESIASYFERNPGMSFIAVNEGEIIGAILGGHDGRRGYIHHLSVHADFQRRGVATRLVDQCLQALAASGIQKCHIFIFNNNAAGIDFWKSIGWTHRSDIGVISKNIEPCDRTKREDDHAIR